jgi:ribose 5-phosphate isomerase RpiB
MPLRAKNNDLIFQQSPKHAHYSPCAVKINYKYTLRKSWALICIGQTGSGIPMNANRKPP